jgi:hypothetical protein
LPPLGETVEPNATHYETYRADLARQRRLYDATVVGLAEG